MDIVVSNGEFWWYENNVVQEPVSTLNFSDTEILIFPNPFSDFIQITNSGQDTYTVKISDVMGRIVYSTKTFSGFIDLSTLNSGIYHLSMTNTATLQTRSTSIVKVK